MRTVGQERSIDQLGRFRDTGHSLRLRLVIADISSDRS
jgi:hypothetical protein